MKVKLPKNWTMARVRRVAAHYDNMSPEERDADLKRTIAADKRRRKKIKKIEIQ